MDPTESPSSGASSLPSKPPHPTNSTPPSHTHPVVPSVPSPMAVRAQNTNRSVQIYQKSDSLPRSSPSATQSSGELRELKSPKDLPRPEEVSEYVHHGIDPAVPPYEITHALPDALILKCADCQRFARVQPNLPGMELLPGPGDRGVHFKCSRCGGGHQMFRHSEKTWLEITLTSLYNLELQDKHKEGRRFFHVRQEICSFADRNWDVICLGRTRTPTWWATLNAQITTRTDLFETSKHGSGNWALRHSNISHPNPAPGEVATLDASKEIPPEKITTMRLGATAIVSKKVIGDRRFYLVTLEGNNGTAWRESTHPCFKSGELIRKFTKVDTPAGKDIHSSTPPTGSPSTHNPGVANGSSTTPSKSKTNTRSKTATTRNSPTAALANQAAFSNQFPSTTPLGVTLGVFTEKVVKAPSRLSRRQQSKQDAALAARAAASSGHSPATPPSSSSSSSSSGSSRQYSPMAESYRKTAKIAAGQLDPSYLGHSASSSQHSNQFKNGAVMNSSAMATVHSTQQHHHQPQTIQTKYSANNAPMMYQYSPQSQVQQHPNHVMMASRQGMQQQQQYPQQHPQLAMTPYQQLKLAQNAQPMRCHQCNRRQLSRPKPGQEFVFCTHTMSKVQGEMTLNVACTQSYCRICVDVMYHEDPLADEHETATWICPACRKICTCATCNDYVDPTGQVAPPSMVVTSSTPTAQLQQQQLQQQQQQRQMQYQMGLNPNSPSLPLNASAASNSLHHHHPHHHLNHNTATLYDNIDSSPGEDASSTTTNCGASSRSTPSGSISLSPNVSTTWHSGMGGKTIAYPGALARSNGNVEGGGSSVNLMKNVGAIIAKIDRKSKVRYLVRMAETGTCKWVTDKPLSAAAVAHCASIAAASRAAASAAAAAASAAQSASTSTSGSASGPALQATSTAPTSKPTPSSTPSNVISSMPQTTTPISTAADVTVTATGEANVKPETDSPTPPASSTTSSSQSESSNKMDVSQTTSTSTQPAPQTTAAPVETSSDAPQSTAPTALPPTSTMPSSSSSESPDALSHDDDNSSTSSATISTATTTAVPSIAASCDTIPPSTSDMLSEKSPSITADAAKESVSVPIKTETVTASATATPVSKPVVPTATAPITIAPILLTTEQSMWYAQSKLEPSLHWAFHSSMKIRIPAYDPTAQPPPKRSSQHQSQQQHSQQQQQQQQNSAPTTSPHNTRSNSGTRSSAQHPLSLYTQTLVSRTPTGRRRNSSATAANSARQFPSLPQQQQQPRSTGKAPQPNHSPHIMHMQPQQMPLYVSTGAIPDSTQQGPPRSAGRFDSLAPSMSYGSLNSPDGFPMPPDRMFTSKGKRPHSELSASLGDIGRNSRRSSLLDTPFGETGGNTTDSKRKFIGSMDDMADFMGNAHELNSPRLAHEPTLEEDDVDPKTFLPMHHHHIHHSVHGPHVLDDSVVAKDVEPIVTTAAIRMVEDEQAVDPQSMIVMPSQVVAQPTAANLVNPAEIMTGGTGGFESWTEGAHHNLVETSWAADAQISNAFESGTSYFS